jgi:hypothetical protein
MIHVHLSQSEQRHYVSLFEGAGAFKRDVKADAKAQRERMLMALESVLPSEKVREIVGDEDLTVRYGVRPAGADRWERFGVAR